MQIIGLLNMQFDDVVVELKTLFKKIIQIGSGQ